jgi:hypothetical protein
MMDDSLKHDHVGHHLLLEAYLTNTYISGVGPHEDSIFNSQNVVYIKYSFDKKNAKQNCPTIYNYQMNPNKRP